jgi:hypothetical protein
MPRFDGTGPSGYGPGTGWGMGPCGGGMGWGRGYGRGYGKGYGRGFGWRRFYSRSEESDMLKDEVSALESELKAVRERLAELKGKK